MFNLLCFLLIISQNEIHVNISKRDIYNKNTMRLKEIREDKQLSQSEVAKLLNVKQNTYSQYETEKRQIPIAMLVQLAEFYAVSVDYLLELTDVEDRYPARY